MKNIMVIVFLSIISLFIGLVIGANNVLPSDFFDINIYHVFNIILTVLIGFFVAYYMNVKNSKRNRKIEYIIKLCNELDYILDEKAILISEYLGDYSDEVKQKAILLFFKTISSRISIIKRLNITLCLSGSDYIEKKCDEYRDTITGNEWGRRTSFDDTYVENFKKDISSCRSTLQKMISDCLNT